MRKLIAALLLALSTVTAAAQVCAPVPALPDSERRTQYSISAQAGPFAVGFQLYGDSTDYADWIGVYINGILQSPATYTLISPSTTLATGCRPISDATILFSTQQTGTLQIVGAQRPRRLSQFAENRGVAARDLNQLQSAVTAMARERWDQMGRVVQAPPGETMALLPPAASRAGQNAGFDAQGNLTPSLPVGGGVAVSGAMQPVVGAASIPIAQGLLGIVSPFGPVVAKTGAYLVVNADKGSTLSLGGSTFYTVTVGAALGYDGNFWVRLHNADPYTGANTGRGKLVSVSGITPFMLYPGQSVVVGNENGVFALYPPPPRWIVPAVPVTFYVDPALGLDTNDGLAPGTGAFKTLATAYNVVKLQVDHAGNAPTIQLAANQTVDVGAGLLVVYGLVGSTELFINGDTGTIVQTSVVNGSCFSARDGGATLTISNMTLQSTTTGGVLLLATQSGVIDVGAGVTFGAAAAGQHINVGNWASINILAPITITGSAIEHLFVKYGGYINYGSFNVSIPSPLAFTIFAAADQLGVISAGGVAMTFSGAGVAGTTGKKYSASTNASIISSATVYPGNVAGTTANGGLFQ